MTKARVTALVLVLVVGLVALGVAYAQWSTTLTINGTVNTGNPDGEWRFVDIQSKDTGIDPGHDKDVGETICPAPGSIDDTLVVTVNNAYPSYTSGCWLKWHNNGNFPMKLCSMGCPNAPGWLTVSVHNVLGEVIDPSMTATGELDFHVEQSAPQGALGATFTCEYNFEVWNKPCP